MDFYILPYDQKTDRPNICYIKGNKKSLLVDAGGGPVEYNLITKMLEDNNLAFPDYVLITHYHWDHMFGIGYFNGITIGSSYTNKKIKEMIFLNPKSIDEFINDEMQPEFCREHIMLEYPDLSSLKLKEIDMVVNNTSIDLGDRVIDIKEVISPHTEGSLIAYDRKSKTLFIGDSTCGKIIGTEFYTDDKKLNLLLSTINEYDFEYVIDGHIDVMTKEEFYKSLEEE